MDTLHRVLHAEKQNLRKKPSSMLAPPLQCLMLTVGPCSTLRLASQQIRQQGSSESEQNMRVHLCAIRPCSGKVAIIQKNERGRMNIVKAAGTSAFGGLV